MRALPRYLKYKTIILLGFLFAVISFESTIILDQSIITLNDDNNKTYSVILVSFLLTNIIFQFITVLYLGYCGFKPSGVLKLGHSADVIYKSKKIIHSENNVKLKKKLIEAYQKSAYYNNKEVKRMSQVVSNSMISFIAILVITLGSGLINFSPNSKSCEFYHG